MTRKKITPNLKTLLLSQFYAPPHKFLSESPSPSLVRYGDNPALQNAVHLERLKQVQVAADRVQDGEDLVVLFVGRLLDFLDRLLDVSWS